MDLSLLAKLDRLQIHAYSNKERTSLTKSFEFLVSVENLSQFYAINYQKTGGIGTDSQEAAHSKTEPRKLQFNVVLDNTCVFNSDLGLKVGNKENIIQKVDNFLTVCYKYDRNQHSPPPLKLDWGEVKFDCRLESVDVKYSLFDKGGNPLRAELDITFIEDIPQTDGAASRAPQSPDITHARIFKAGDSLPLIAKEVYGSANYYLSIARWNKINHFREIKPGTKIKLPPIQQLERVS